MHLYTKLTIIFIHVEYIVVKMQDIKSQDDKKCI